jgi:ABC-type sugar transport system substrate-binding protein
VFLIGNGCDGPTVTTGLSRTTSPTETTTVAILLPATGIAELDVWEATARRQEALTKAIAEVHRMTPGDPPSRQADMIKEVVASGVSALVVMADDPNAIATAIDDARKEGVPVVLLDRAVPSTATPPPPLVRYESESESAKALVAAACEDAKKAGFPPEGPAMILANGPGDEHAQARVKAIRSELKARGVRVLPDLVFTGLNAEVKAALTDACRATPHVAMIFAEENVGLGGSALFRHALDHKSRRFVLAGYTADLNTLELVKYNTCAGEVDRNINEPMRKAFETALALVRGETVPGKRPCALSHRPST